ncbi:MAG: bifunctional methylenetetrahydrofolate dehydrogenase/methenyltetrahydrofolate cyclohydrolase FolD [Actinomycetota bacterium]|jgi:methylenetetrahydrofolate dehydrogenase (NADP+)/methenyltetrahydrofolate cyclohydrolase|nr:bifunctional methylenetetrahydrofolate dehydrogenase/methenyltetrahydrofolate cyclohydrolase FolD [Actinomycetota bacterium]MDD5601152.1 bifunctional methylenetetrahydrofolate dehydrogenase/methenyltetrahydrofolate cyclohydrolase FolD [Actinomycetota bacterium]
MEVVKIAKLINGSKISQDIKREIAEEVEELKRTKGFTPGLGVILVGDDPASRIYVNNKQKSCNEVGFYSETIKMEENISTEDILQELNKLNNRGDIHGILVQLPLPPQIDKAKVLEAIYPEKDVDGFHPVNMGRLVANQECLVPATPSGIIEMLKRENITIKGKNAAMVGHSEIVGKPTALLLLNEWATVTICHIETRDLKASISDADILVVATGVPYLIKDDMVKEGAVVIDVGINRITKDKASQELLEWRKEDFEKKGVTLIGDVDFLKVEPKVSYITPVPGGVGPMTIAMLLKNTLKAAKMQLKI